MSKGWILPCSQQSAGCNESLTGRGAPAAVVTGGGEVSMVVQWVGGDLEERGCPWSCGRAWRSPIVAEG